MKDKNRIEELTKLLEKSIRQTLNNFEELTTATNVINDPVYLEAWLAQLFVFDYIANAASISQEFRQNFLEKQFNEVESNYLYLIRSDDPLKTVENRFNKYAEIPMHQGDSWFETFTQSLYQNLLGSKKHQVMLESYDLPSSSQEVLSPFQEKEAQHFHWLQSAIPLVINKKQKAEKAWQNASKSGDHEQERSWLQRLKKWAGFNN